MWNKLKELLVGKPPLELNHEYFGTIIFMGGDEPNDDDYWETEAIIKEAAKPITLIIEAGIEGPNDAQISFYKTVVLDVDTLFNRCWPIFEPDFMQWTGKEFSGDWTKEFELEGVRIPKNGDENGEWDVTYFVNAAEHWFTANFVGGAHAYNQIDG